MTSGLRYDLARVAQWSVPLTWVLIAVQAAYVAERLVALNFLNRGIAGEITESDMAAGIAEIDNRAIVLGLAALALVIVVYTLNGIWVYRASSNAGVMQPREGRISPGWAVGWYFVPIANLWKPFVAMRETWVASRPDPIPGGLLGWWWALWTASSLIASASGYLAVSAVTFEELRTLVYIDLLATPISILSMVLFVRIVRKITTAQSAHGPAAIFA